MRYRLKNPAFLMLPMPNRSRVSQLMHDSTGLDVLSIRCSYFHFHIQMLSHCVM